MRAMLRLRCLWWVGVCAAASVTPARAAARTAEATVTQVKDSKECKLLNLSLEPTFYKLPTNLTIKPMSAWWHLKFVLSVEQAPPIACIRLEEGVPWPDLSMFSGDCDSGKNEYLGYLSSVFKLKTWTILSLNATSDAVLVHEPQGGSVRLTGPGFTLPQDGLKMTVTEAWGVEATVGCAVSCPLHYQPSRGPGIKERVNEWKQESLYFHFRPGPSFSSLHYDVRCTTRQNKVFRREVDIKPGELDAARDWNFVELEQKQSNATVRLNNKLLETIELPVSCISSMHIIWTVGDGSFGFNCTPSGAEQATKERDSQTNVSQSGALMHPGAAVGITLALVVVLQCIGFLIWYFIKKKNKRLDGERSASNATSLNIESQPQEGAETEPTPSDSLLRHEMATTRQPEWQPTNGEQTLASSTQDQARMNFPEKSPSVPLSTASSGIAIYSKRPLFRRNRKVQRHTYIDTSSQQKVKIFSPRRSSAPASSSFSSWRKDDDNSPNSEVTLQFENKAFSHQRDREPLLRSDDLGSVHEDKDDN